MIELFNKFMSTIRLAGSSKGGELSFRDIRLVKGAEVFFLLKLYSCKNIVKILF